MLRAHHESPKGLRCHPGTQLAISTLSASWQRGRDAEHHILAHQTCPQKSHSSPLPSFHWPREVLNSARQEGTIPLKGWELWEGTRISGKQKYSRLQLLRKKGCSYQVWVSSTKNNGSTPSHRGRTSPQNLSLPNSPDNHYLSGWRVR